jgi:hypothetical protein
MVRYNPSSNGRDEAPFTGKGWNKGYFNLAKMIGVKEKKQTKANLEKLKGTMGPHRFLI